MSRSWTITDPDSPLELEDGPPLPPIHPGEMLATEFMEELNLTSEALAKAMGVSQEHLQAILDCKAPITAEDSLRLGHVFSMSDGFWMRLQNHYDLELVLRSDVAEDISRLPVLHAAE